MPLTDVNDPNSQWSFGTGEGDAGSENALFGSILNSQGNGTDAYNNYLGQLSSANGLLGAGEDHNSQYDAAQSSALNNYLQSLYGVNRDQISAGYQTAGGYEHGQLFKNNTDGTKTAIGADHVTKDDQGGDLLGVASMVLPFVGGAMLAPAAAGTSGADLAGSLASGAESGASAGYAGGLAGGAEGFAGDAPWAGATGGAFDAVEGAPVYNMTTGAYYGPAAGTAGAGGYGLGAEGGGADGGAQGGAGDSSVPSTFNAAQDSQLASMNAGFDPSTMGAGVTNPAIASTPWTNAEELAKRYGIKYGAKYLGSKTDNPYLKGALSLGGSAMGGAGFGLDDLATGLSGLYLQNQQGNALKSQAAGLSNLYGEDSPYATTMRNQLARRDAAAGRRSQYGNREVELQAALAGLNSRNAPQLNAISNQQLKNNAGMANTAIQLLGKNGLNAGSYLKNMFNSGGGQSQVGNSLLPSTFGGTDFSGGSGFGGAIGSNGAGAVDSGLLNGGFGSSLMDWFGG